MRGSVDELNLGIRGAEICDRVARLREEPIAVCSTGQGIALNRVATEEPVLSGFAEKRVGTLCRHDLLAGRTGLSQLGG